MATQRETLILRVRDDCMLLVREQQAALAAVRDMQVLHYVPMLRAFIVRLDPTRGETLRLTLPWLDTVQTIESARAPVPGAASASRCKLE